jgi:hypothetical protein
MCIINSIFSNASKGIKLGDIIYKINLKHHSLALKFVTVDVISLIIPHYYKTYVYYGLLGNS